jgi:tetratricopeptide (TPR) repeat protein
MIYLRFFAPLRQVMALRPTLHAKARRRKAPQRSKENPKPYSRERNKLMKYARLVVTAFIVCLTVIAINQTVSAQEQKMPNHVHYKEPAQQGVSPTGAIAPRLQKLGTHTFPVSTKNAQAQLFMNQGLNLSYAFNHAEAGRAYREAERLDPNLAIAFWGEALALGPNINAPMDPAAEPKALEVIQKAVALKPKASPREAALIDALTYRYSGKAEDRRARDVAYADAMRKVHLQFPDDDDISMLYVESVMDLRPWGYWTRDGLPYDRTAEVVALTEKVIAKNPNHPGALHLYIHLMEAFQADKAEVAADRLLTLMPAAGHMVHMPAHIYQRVGRYADAQKSNEMAIAADEDYISQCRAQGLYPMAYYPHNLHFLWFAATAQGNSKIAIEAARKAASQVSEETLKAVPLLAGFRVVPYYALTRFGKWDEMLREPEPPSSNVYLTGMWRYARGTAFLGKGQTSDAEAELAKVSGLMSDKSLDSPLFSPNTALAVLTIGQEVLAGNIAASKKNYDEAVAHLERAVRLEDALVYTEPAEFHYPPRQALGAVLLAAGRPAEAETVYWEDLKRNRESGWSLFGLMQALKAQNKNDDAALVEARFKKAWARADVTLIDSRFGK